MADTPTTHAPKHLASDTRYRAQSHKGKVTQAKTARKAKEAYQPLLVDRLDKLSADEAYTWIDSGAAFCELASWIAGRAEPYKDPRRAEAALRQRRDGLACVGLVAELLAMAGAMLSGGDPRFTHVGSDLVVGLLEREVKAINLRLETSKGHPAFNLSRAQYLNPKLTSVQVFVQATHPRLGSSRIYADIPADVLRRYIGEHHGKQLRKGGSIVVPLDTTDRSPFAAYFHTSFRSFVQSLTSADQTL